MTDIVKGVLQPKTFRYEWKIERFFADCEEVGDAYTSPVFSVHHPDEITEWYFRVYPKGLEEGDEDHVIIWLNFSAENTTQLTVDFRFSIVSEQNSLLGSEEKITAKFKGPSLGYRFDLVEQNIIKDALIDDTLKILCEITFHPIAKNVTDGSHVLYDEWRTENGNGLDDYGELFESSSFTDVTFNVQDNKIHLHKAILSCRSPVFKAMFEHEMEEKKQSSVDVTDVDYEVMRELFRFVYSEKVENIKEIAKDLFIAADKYSVTGLKVLCENALYNDLTVDNAIEYLQLTDTYDTIYLKALVIKFIATHCKVIMKKPEFVDLNSNLMYQIIQAITEKD